MTQTELQTRPRTPATAAGPSSSDESRHACTLRMVEPREYPVWDAALAASAQDYSLLRTSPLFRLASAAAWNVVLVGCYEGDALIGGFVGRAGSDGNGGICAGVGGRGRGSGTVVNGVGNGSAVVIAVGRDTAVSGVGSNSSVVNNVGVNNVGVGNGVGVCTGLDRLLLVPYNGCWVGPSAAAAPHRVQHHAQRVLTNLAQLTPARFFRATIDLHPTNDDVRPFLWNGWEAAVRYTMINDLSVWTDASLAPSVRRRARRAARAGVEFDRCVPAGEFADLWASSFRRQGLALPLTPQAMTGLLNDLGEAGILLIHGSRLPDGRLVAATAILLGEDSAYYWLAGFDPAEPNRGAANQLCHLEMLRSLSGRVRWFDWIGANTPRIAAYKEAFAPRLVPYYRVSHPPRRQGSPISPRPTLRRWLGACCALLGGTTRRASCEDRSSRLNAWETQDALSDSGVASGCDGRSLSDADDVASDVAPRDGDGGCSSALSTPRRGQGDEQKLADSTALPHLPRRKTERLRTASTPMPDDDQACKESNDGPS